MAKLPVQIVAGTFVFGVSTEANELNKECRAQQADLAGQTDFKFLRVLIDPDQAPQQKADTILHECLHIVTERAGLRSEWGDEKDESTVRRLTPWLLDILVKNPDLLKFLVEPS